MPKHQRQKFRIPKPKIRPQTEPLRFSFKHFQADHPKFGVDECPREFFSALMNRLSVYSEMAVQDFREQNARERRHTIDFEQTTEQRGFLGAPGVDENNLAYAEAWQFGLLRVERWRVHGFVIDDTFYVVWLDPNHLLYPD